MSKTTKDKIKFNKSFYPKYDILSIREKFFLRTCCYFPPKKKRSPSKENVLDNFCKEITPQIAKNKRHLIPKLPKMRNLNVSEVLKSDYFY